MDTLEYQKRLADFDLEIQQAKLMAQQAEYKRAQFIATVLTNTSNSKKSGTLPDGISVTKAPGV